MHKFTIRLGLATLTASLLLSAAVTSATARSLSTSNQSIRATWTGLEFRATELGIRCQVTLEGSFHTRTIAKVAGALIGSITRAFSKQETCADGTAAMFNGVERYNRTNAPNTLPWHLTYESFSGTLPNISTVRILLSRFRFGIRDGAAICTGQYGDAEDSVTLSANREAAGAIASLEPVAGRNTASLVRRDAGLLCPEIRLTNPASVMLLGATTRITITLI
jgi:hypothetical protein